MTQSKNGTYLAQVKGLRLLALEALEQYPIKVKKLELKRYAANTTYKVTDNRNKNYQLRILPKQWHTKAALSEEIGWINHISKTMDVVVPRPIRTKNDQFVIACQHPSVIETRYCELFDWLPGKRKWRSINREYAQDLGAIIARLQKNGQSMTIKHRHYCDVDSLVSTSNARYFNVEKLSDINQKQQTMITEVRRAVYSRLKHYEDRHKDKSGLIHGDLQPNNVLYHNKKIAVIDFDNCGIGLYGFELGTALHAFHQVTKSNKKKCYEELKEGLYDGYSRFMPLAEEDIQLMPYFILALRLVTIGWLEREKDNPSLRKYYNIAITDTIDYFKKIED